MKRECKRLPKTADSKERGRCGKRRRGGEKDKKMWEGKRRERRERKKTKDRRRVRRNMKGKWKQGDREKDNERQGGGMKSMKKREFIIRNGVRKEDREKKEGRENKRGGKERRKSR